MRILIVHNLLWSHYKSSVFQALQQLVDQQTDLTIKVLQIARNERSRAGLEAIDTEVAPTYTYNYELLFDQYLEEISLPARTQALLRQARAFQPHVINLTGYYDPAQLVLLMWAKARGIRVIMQNESTAADHQRGGWKEKFKRWIISQCDGFFCFGTQSANYIMRLGVPSDKILLRKNAVDNTTLRMVYEKAFPNRIKQQESQSIRPNNFVFVGRLIAFKNLSTLLSAFAEAQKKSARAQNWGLLLLGDGPENNQLQQQSKELGLTDAVKFMPGRAWFQVPDVLVLSDVLVLPSWSEPWGLVVNEALACGLPVIVSDRCGCVPDLVHDGQNGFVFDPYVPDQLTDLLLCFIDDKVNWQQMKASAQQSVTFYSPEAVARDMLNGFMTVGRLKTAESV